jgi:hypothetical protein
MDDSLMVMGARPFLGPGDKCRAEGSVSLSHRLVKSSRIRSWPWLQHPSGWLLARSGNADVGIIGQGEVHFPRPAVWMAVVE